MCFISYITPDYEKYFTNIIEMFVDESNDELLIWSDLAIKSADVMPIEYVESSGTFSEGEIRTYTHCDNIQIGEALKVRLFMPCGIPSHRIVVTGQDDNEFSFIPILSGVNNSLGLLTHENFIWGAFSFH